jgi:sphingomyelin phosphodiesterase
LSGTVYGPTLQVLVIAHIPPGDDDNLAEYGEVYLNMTRQFSDTIVGHLFGHTHMDQFQLVNSLKALPHMM